MILSYPFTSYYPIQEQGNFAANEMELGRLKVENRKAIHMVQQLMKTNENLHEFCINELLNGDENRSG